MTALLAYFFLALFLSFLCSLLEAVLLSTPSSYASILKKKNTKTLIAPILQKRLADQLEQKRLKME